MATTVKKYDTSYKKRTDTDRDTYLPKRSPEEMLQCLGCAAFYHRRHWTLTKPTGFDFSVRVHLCYCPACRKIKDQRASGELDLASNGNETKDVLRILRNEEGRAREKNPLGRIMRIEEVNSGWRVQTTTEKLAQRLGRAVRKARGGKLQYKWSHNNKFLRVTWDRQQTGSQSS
ncbi:MAG TPA: BCAM0308 family protein [Candidatus Binatia bacterium]|nr:BCAM0308 family protein [Candidatus Binatia bacterium]